MQKDVQQNLEDDERRTFVFGARRSLQHMGLSAGSLLFPQIRSIRNSSSG